jgi:hypothetical protein
VTWDFPQHGRFRRHTRHVASEEAVRLSGAQPGVSAQPAYQFLSRHEAAVIGAAIHRLALDHSCAHAVSYLDRVLSVFRVLHTSGPLHHRVVALRHRYVDGVALLDERAGGDFTAVPPLRQDLILSQCQLESFTDLLCDHIAETIQFSTSRAD